MKRMLAIGGLHVLACLFFLHFAWPDQANLLTPDSMAYDRLAVNLIANQVFSLEHGPPFIPYTFRTPVYPLFLVGLYVVFGHNPVVPVLVQILFNLCTLQILFATGRLLLGQPQAYWGCVVLAVSGVFVLHTRYILTESLSAFLLAPVVYALAWISRSGEGDTLFGLRRLGLIAVIGALLGVLTLCRPGSFYLAILLAPVVLVQGGRAVLGRRVQAVAVAGLCFVLVLSPWLARNYYYFQSVRIDSLHGFNLYYTTVATMRALDGDLSLEESMARMRAAEPDHSSLNVMELDKKRQQMAIAAIADEPLDFVAVCLYGFAVTMSPISPQALDLYIGDGEFGRSATVEAGRLARSGQWGNAFSLAVGSGADLSSWLGSIFFSLLDLSKYWLCILAVLVLGRNREGRDALLILLPVILYFLLVTSPLGPQGAFRYRFAAEPYLSLLAGGGICALVGMARPWRNRNFLLSLGLFAAFLALLGYARFALGVSLV